MARKVIAEFDAIDGPFINKLRAIDASITRFEVGTLSSFGRVEKGLNGLLASASRLQAVSGIIAGGFGTSLATNFIDQATRIRRALKEAGDESQEGFEKAFQAAQRSLSGFESFSQGVQRFSKATGDGFDRSIRYLETLNKLLVLGGKTTQERMSTMIQFSQALQANVLQGEELRSLRENAPIELIRAIVREAGGGIEDLKEFGSQGKLTADVMIRALQSLEKEADQRMRSVTLSIGEAATVLGNAAVVATEGFDRGLGLSRTAVAGLTGLANVLGQSAEAAEAFGKAVQVAMAVGIGAFAGSRINSAIGSTREYGASLYQAAAAADAQVVSTTRAIEAARRRVAASTALIDKLAMQTGTERKLEAANRARERALAALTVAEARHAAAVTASDAAQRRLLFTSRALAATGALLRGAWAFLGGWPGLILTAGLAFLTLRGNVESAAERFDRLKGETFEAGLAADRLRDVQARLNEAIAEAGRVSDESSRKIVANTLEELRHKKNLLQVETNRLKTLQADREEEIRGFRSQIAGIYGNVEDQRGLMSLSGVVDQAALDQMLADADAAAAPLRDKIIELEAAMFQTGQTIQQNTILLEDAAQSANGLRDGIVEAAEGSVRLTDEALTKFNDLLAKKQQEIGLQQLINQYGAESAQVADFRAAAERAAYEEMAKTSGITGEFLQQLMDAYDEAAALAGLDLSSGVNAAAAAAAVLAQNLGISYATALALSRLGPQGSGGAADPSGKVYSGRGGDPRSQGGSALDWQVRDADRFLKNWKPPSAGGGGGGGRARENELDREALSLIESMMTAEERRAQKMQEAVALRESLVQKYGTEHEMVQRVDEAIQRMNQNLKESKTLAEQFWDTISDSIASSIEDWKGWGNFVRSVLASLVRSYGEDFFVALLTPGGQYKPGGGLGSYLGDLVTGQLHSGGGMHDRQTRHVPAAAFIGAPRFHKGLLGLKSDEFTAILQKGETVLPKGMSLGGSSFTIVNQNDFRGVDNASREYIEGRLREMERNMPAQAVQAVRDAQRKREL